MSYRSLLVLLDSQPTCADRTRVATQLAAALDAHLVGLAPTGLVDLPLAVEAAASLTEYAALAWDTLRGQAERAAQEFRGACEAAGVKSFEALVDESDQAPSLVRHAHCSDLTILTQADPDAAGHRQAQELVEQVVLYSARPTLVLPCAGRFDNIGSKVMVAWDDSREAARALADALPLLRRSRRVHIVSWREAGSDAADLPGPNLDALQRWMLWHGVRAEVRTEATDIGIADAMLSRAADLDIDLLVMGAYGHARWAERVLGGATRGLLASMTVPVLMSH